MPSFASDNRVPRKQPVSLTVLGSGTCVPSLARSSCAVLLTLGRTSILVDIGQGTIRRLLKAGVSIFSIDHILISHLHPDHTGELASFLFSTKYATTDSRDRPLCLTAGKGFSAFYDRLVKAYGPAISLEPEMLRIRWGMSASWGLERERS